MTDEKEIQERETAPEAGSSPGAHERPDLAAPGNGDGSESPTASGGPDGPGTGDGGEAGDEMAAEVDGLRRQLEALNDQHLRLAADFDNYRKRNERERGRMATRLQADVVESLLDVLDDLQRVEESGVGTEAASVLEGVRLVEKKFIGVLEAAGLEPVDAEGAAFNPELMEALAGVPTDEPEQDHRVADVFQRGYRFRDVLIRPARVRVWQYEESEGSE